MSTFFQKWRNEKTITIGQILKFRLHRRPHMARILPDTSTHSSIAFLTHRSPQFHSNSLAHIWKFPFLFSLYSNKFLWKFSFSCFFFLEETFLLMLLSSYSTAVILPYYRVFDWLTSWDGTEDHLDSFLMLFVATTQTLLCIEASFKNRV